MKKTTHSSIFWLVSGVVLSPIVILALIYLTPILFTVFVTLFTVFVAFFTIAFGGLGLFILLFILMQMIKLVVRES